MPRPVLTLVAIVALAGAAPLAAQTSLAWKFRPGATFAVEQHIVQTTALETKNKPFQQKSVLALRTRWQVKEAAKEGAKILVTVESMTSKTFTGDGKTAVPAKDDELWRGSEFRLVVDPQGRLRELMGHEALLKKLAGANPQKLKILAALKPPDSFRALLQQVLGPLPDRPVQAGDRWQTAAVDTMSIFGSFVQTTDFTYEGLDAGRHAVKSATKTVYKAPRYAIENDVFRIVKGEVNADEGQGSLLFDAGLGRMLRVHNTISLRGELTLETLTGRQRLAFRGTTEVKIEVK